MSEHVNYMRLLPGGLCFAHGPYTKTTQCPKWPECITAPHDPKWVEQTRQQMAEQPKCRGCDLLNEEIQALRDEIRLKSGAAKADNERLIAAAAKAGIPFGGCDTPDDLAEALVELRELVRLYLEAQRDYSGGRQMKRNPAEQLAVRIAYHEAKSAMRKAVA